MSDILFLTIVMVVAVVAAVGSIVLFGRHRTRQRDAAAASAFGRREDPLAGPRHVGGDVGLLDVGDFFAFEGRDFVVRGKLQLSESGWGWKELFVDNGNGETYWLSVENDPEKSNDPIVILWVGGTATDYRPGQQSVTHEGRIYTFMENETARYEASGTTGLNLSGTVHYYDYKGAGGRYLSFESYDGGRYELSIGRPIPDGGLTIYPAA